MSDSYVTADEIDLEDVELEDRIVIAERMDVIFDTNSYAANTIPVATGIDCSSWRRAMLVAVLHAGGSTWATPATSIEIYAEAISLDPTAPATVFVGNIVALAGFDQYAVAPALSLGPWFGAWGARARVMLRFLLEDSAGTEPLTATVSIYVIGRRRRPSVEAVAMLLDAGD